MSTYGKLNLKNQFGEFSENAILGMGVDTANEDGLYSGTGSFQILGPDLPLDPAAGSDDAADPKFLAPIMGNLIGEDLENEGNYLAGVIGAYSVTGTKATHYPAGALLGIIMDGVTDADGAVIAEIDGDSAVTIANAAFKAMMKNSNAGSGFNYGLDLHCAGIDSYLDLAILKADLRLSHQVCVLQGATAPVDGTTGDNFAAKGSLYIARDTGNLYRNSGTITDSVWQLFESGDSPLGQALTGFVSGAGTVSATDTILTAFNKLVGNTQNLTVTGNLLTGLGAGSNTAILAGDSILIAMAKLQAQITALV